MLFNLAGCVNGDTDEIVWQRTLVSICFANPRMLWKLHKNDSGWKNGGECRIQSLCAKPEEIHTNLLHAYENSITVFPAMGRLKKLISTQTIATLRGSSCLEEGSQITRFTYRSTLRKRMSNDQSQHRWKTIQRKIGSQIKQSRTLCGKNDDRFTSKTDE